MGGSTRCTADVDRGSLNGAIPCGSRVSKESGSIQSKTAYTCSGIQTPEHVFQSPSLPQPHRRGYPSSGLRPFPRRQHTEIYELRTKQLSRIFQRFLACFFALSVSFLLLRRSHRSSRWRPPPPRLVPREFVDFIVQIALLLIVIYGDAMLWKLRIAQLCHHEYLNSRYIFNSNLR